MMLGPSRMATAFNRAEAVHISGVPTAASRRDQLIRPTPLTRGKQPVQRASAGKNESAQITLTSTTLRATIHRMIRRIIVLAAGVAIVGMTNPGAYAAPARSIPQATASRSVSGVAVPGYTNRTSVQLCDTETVPLCMNGYDGNDMPVDVFQQTPGYAQNVSITQLSNCGGTVTNTCPFADSELDTEFHGQTIVSITNDKNNMAYAADQNVFGAVIEETSGGGQVWVLDGDLSDNAFLVNVWASDSVGDAEYACDSGSPGSEVTLGGGSAYYPNCLWWALSGS